MKKQTKLGLILAAAAVITVSVASLVSARGWVQQNGDWYYLDNSNEYVTEKIQASGNSKFYLGEDGKMMRDFLLEQYGDNTENYYYFGSNGAMVTNTWVAVDSSIVENQYDNYTPDVYWYYFQASGKAMKGTSDKCKKATIDGKKYAFDQYGHMLVGWFDEKGEVKDPDGSNPFEDAVYYAGGDNDGVLRAGWLTYYDGYDGDEAMADYANLYFYFNTSNNKKAGYKDGNGKAESKKINGKNYVFDEHGIMLSGWDPYDMQVDVESLKNKITYFSGEDDGHQVKKGWVYAVPSENLDKSKFDDDEEAYMYFGANGDIEKDKFKKVNGKFYAFSETGIMKTGIVIWAPNKTSDNVHFVDTVDLDNAQGSDIVKKGLIQVDDNLYIKVNYKGVVEGVQDSDGAGQTGPNNVDTGDQIKLHNFGTDGARKTGSNTVEFTDDNYTLWTTGSIGDKGTGTFSKKYYVLGIQLKASQDIRYGIFATATDNIFQPQHDDTTHPNYEDYYNSLQNNSYIVLTTNGGKQKGSTSAKKDADGNYWLVQPSTGALKGIWTVNVSTAKTFSNGWTTRKVQYAAAPASSSSCNYDDLVSLGLAVDNPGWMPSGNNTTITNVENTAWTFHKDGDLGYFKLKVAGANKKSITMNAYQSDYGDGSNKWIPMGLTDNSDKTVIADPTGNYDAEAHAYDVLPSSNDYFLNCYWVD